MDRTQGLKTRGAADKETLVRGEVRGLVGMGRIKVAGPGMKRGESTVSGEKTRNRVMQQILYLLIQSCLRPLSEATLDMAN